MITAPLAQLADIGIFLSGTIVIGTARLVLMLALFLFLERVIGSARAAGIGVAIYACNPSFLYFDSQFGYESLALVDRRRAAADHIALDRPRRARAPLEPRAASSRGWRSWRRPSSSPIT